MNKDTAVATGVQSAWNEDLADLETLRESIQGVLESEAGRLELHAFIDGKAPLDRLLWSKAIDLGWLAIGLPEQYGGLGFGPRGLDVLHRELGRKAAPGSFMATLSAAQALLETADAATKDEWLPRLASGECAIAVPASFGDNAASGETWLLGAEDAAAALAPVGGGAWGLIPLGSTGIQRVDMWDRTRTILCADLSAVVPQVLLADGEAVAKSLSRHLALAVASDSIGGARAITEQTIGYMKERQQFGRAIASFQALKHRAADLMTLIVIGEQTVSQGVEAAAAGDLDADMWAALAKAHGTDGYVAVGVDCTQLHGGVGYTWEFDVHIHLKRARLNEMLVAPNAAMRDAAAAHFADAARAERTTLELAI